MIDHASPSRDTGMCAQACSIGSLAVNLRFTTIGAISRSFICLWKAVMWEKPTVQPSWDNGSANGKRRPSAVLTRKKRRLPQPLPRRFGLAYKKRSRKPKSRGDGQPVRVKRRSSLIASARRSILLMCWKRLLPCRNLRLPACGCRKQSRIQTETIPSMFCPYVHMRRRRTDETSCVASLRWLHRNPLRVSVSGALAPGVEAEAMACDCCRAGLRQDDGYPRCEQCRQP